MSGPSFSTSQPDILRLQAAVLVARNSRSRSTSARSMSRGLRRTAADLRERARIERQGIDRPEAEADFELRGQLGDRVVRASFTGGRLSCDPELETQARLLVALGERFVGEGRIVHASLEEGWLSALLTLMRACDRVLHSEVRYRARGQVIKLTG